MLVMLLEPSYSLCLELSANTFLAFSIPLVLLRTYMAPADKEKFSNAVPQNFDEIMSGVMLGEYEIKEIVVWKFLHCNNSC